jgi:hypothetical protein
MKSTVIFYLCHYTGDDEAILNRAMKHLNMDEPEFFAAINEEDLSFALTEIKKKSDIIFLIGDIGKSNETPPEKSTNVNVNQSKLKYISPDDIIKALLNGDNITKDRAQIRITPGEKKSYLIENGHKISFILPDEPNLLYQTLKYNVLPYLAKKYEITNNKLKLKKFFKYKKGINFCNLKIIDESQKR